MSEMQFVIIKNTDSKKFAKTMNKIMTIGGIFQSDMYIVKENKKNVYLRAVLLPVKKKEIPLVDEEEL